MTLLSIADAVADETKGPRPATIAGNTDPAAQNVLRLINKVGYRLMLMFAWDRLKTEATVTAPGTETLIASASMPADFNRFVPETMWDRDTNNLISGPIGSVEWNGLKVQTFSSQNKKFIYRGGDVLTSPAIASGVTVAYEYVKDTWCDIAAGGGAKTAMSIDTDVSLINEEVVTAAAVFAWLDANGQPSGSAARSFKEVFDTVTANEDASANIAVTADIFAQNSRHFDGEPKASRASYGGDF